MTETKLTSQHRSATSPLPGISTCWSIAIGNGGNPYKEHTLARWMMNTCEHTALSGSKLFLTFGTDDCGTAIVRRWLTTDEKKDGTMSIERAIALLRREVRTLGLLRSLTTSRTLR